MIAETLKKAIGGTLKEMGIENRAVELEHPAELSHGDFSTNVALVYAKELKLKPRELAEKIVKKIQDSRFKIQEIEKIEIAGPGFINFHLSQEFFVDEIAKIDENIGKNKNLSGKKVMVEYTDPNPFKEFHIGHLMSNAVGESIARLFEFQGAEVRRACYQGDVGLHVAKAVWGIFALEKTGDILNPNVSASEQAAYLGKAYAKGAVAYEESGEAKEQIITINTKIYNRQDAEVNNIYDMGKQWSLYYFETLYAILGTKFNFYFFESETGEFGKHIVEGKIGEIFERSEGAVVFPESKSGLHTRVFINSQGLPTYEAKELGLAKIKANAYPYDVSVIITGNEVNDYFKVLIKAMEFVFPDLAKKTKHLSHGMMRLPTGKMSSRTGKVITGEVLILQVEELVHEKVKDREMSAEEKKELAQVVAVGAIKYSILRQAIGGDIIFDFEKSISFEGDSGPYLQYSYVRAKAVLKKAKEADIQPVVEVRPQQLGETTTLEKLLVRFPEVVERAGTEYEPHFVTTYLTELAGVFNSWYANGKIVDANDPTSPYKLTLTKAFTEVMKNGLWLLGIKVPEKM